VDHFCLIISKSNISKKPSFQWQNLEYYKREQWKVICSFFVFISYIIWQFCSGSSVNKTRKLAMISQFSNLMCWSLKATPTVVWNIGGFTLKIGGSYHHPQMSDKWWITWKRKGYNSSSNSNNNKSKSNSYTYTIKKIDSLLVYLKSMCLKENREEK